VCSRSIICVGGWICCFLTALQKVDYVEGFLLCVDLWCVDRSLV